MRAAERSITLPSAAAPAGLHPSDMLEFARRTPDGAVLTIETHHAATCYPMNTMAIALGLHVRVGIEDNAVRPRTASE